MSFIPQNAVGASLSALQRPRNDAATARAAVARNSQHHAEDINELDENAVDTINDSNGESAGNGQQQNPSQQHSEDLVEIASLTAQPHPIAKKSPPPATSSLDISA